MDEYEQAGPACGRCRREPLGLDERFLLLMREEFVMPYVSRSNGSINGLYEQFQEGLAEEFMPDGNPQIIAFENAPAIIFAVSARQFKLQLLAVGLLDAVNAWVSGQSREVQIAFEYSGTFVKNSPMMIAGFAAMGFTDEQIEEFFSAASEL